jgi:hypothetical protein
MVSLCAVARRIGIGMAIMVAAAGAGGMQANAAGNIDWSKSGPYETCLQSEADTWLNARAEDVVNGAESVKSLDDAKVAAWTVDAMKACTAKGAPADAGNEAAFAKFMARWREHLYELARVIRAKGGSD